MFWPRIVAVYRHMQRKWLHKQPVSSRYGDVGMSRFSGKDRIGVGALEAGWMRLMSRSVKPEPRMYIPQHSVMIVYASCLYLRSANAAGGFYFLRICRVVLSKSERLTTIDLVTRRDGSVIIMINFFFFLFFFSHLRYVSYLT
jgi:hypothetical protein